MGCEGGGDRMRLKIDEYMETRLLKLNYELYHTEGVDVTLLIGALMTDHAKLNSIKEVVLS